MKWGIQSSIVQSLIVQLNYRKILFGFFRTLFTLAAIALLTATIHHGETMLFPETGALHQTVMPLIFIP